jgi:hypothetical protein
MREEAKKMTRQQLSYWQVSEESVGQNVGSLA